MFLYSWGVRSDFLIHHVANVLFDLEAIPGETAEAVLTRIADAKALPTPFMFQVNLTTTDLWPLDRVTLVNRLRRSNCTVLNGTITDISKNRIAKAVRNLGLPDVTLVGSEHSDTMVIVKTNQNYGGLPEKRLAKQTGEARFGDEQDLIDGVFGYEVKALRAVPSATRSDPKLVIQRYISNKENVIFRVYISLQNMVITRAVNPDVIKKMRPGLERENYLTTRKSPLAGVMKKIRDDCVRAIFAMGLDFGTIDVVLSDEGVPYIIDVNPTPGWGRETQPELIEHLRLGLLA